MLHFQTTNVTLNPEQQKAVDQAKAFLKNKYSKGSHFVITGSPGTGKTFILKYIFENSSQSVVGATVSHAAKTVLQNILGEDIKCTTIAALYKLTQHITNEGEITFVIPKNYYDKPRSYPSIIILDEVSQIPDKIYDLIMYEAREYGTKIIAVGDPYQLPPVEQEDDSKFFTTIDVTLNEVMRFQGPIAEITPVFKRQIDLINNGDPFDKYALNALTHRKSKVVDGSGYSFSNSLDFITSAAADDIKSHMNDLLFARVLAFKNDNVAELNRILRLKIYGENLNQFEDSELVICNGGYTVPHVNAFSNTITRTPVLYNGQILRVSKSIQAIGPEEVPCLLVAFKDFKNSSELPIYVVENTPEAKTKYESIKARLAKEAKTASSDFQRSDAWRRYYQFVESFAYLDYCLSSNVYKSQGQTLTNIYVCEGEILDVKPLTWKQKFQALYVAVTRAKQNLIIYNKNY